MPSAAATPKDTKSKVDTRRVLTPEFRVSFPHVFKAHAFKPDQEAKFSIVMLFPKATKLDALKRACVYAATEKFGERAKWPKNLRLPFRDGDEEKSEMEGYSGCIFVSAGNKTRPGLVDQAVRPIADDDGMFYAGCYARATLIAFGYDAMGNKGVSFSLQNVQKLRDGEPFSGRRKAEDDFEAVEDFASDDALSDTDSLDDLM